MQVILTQEEFDALVPREKLEKAIANNEQAAALIADLHVSIKVKDRYINEKEQEIELLRQNMNKYFAELQELRKNKHGEAA